jgi:hypothetical protein
MTEHPTWGTTLRCWIDEVELTNKHFALLLGTVLG